MFFALRSIERTNILHKQYIELDKNACPIKETASLILLLPSYKLFDNSDLNKNKLSASLWNINKIYTYSNILSFIHNNRTVYSDKVKLFGNYYYLFIQPFLYYIIRILLSYGIVTPSSQTFS